MNTSMVKGMAIGGIAMVVLAAGGVTGYTTLTKPMVAEVVAVKEATEKVVTPRELCEDVPQSKRIAISARMSGKDKKMIAVVNGQMINVGGVVAVDHEGRTYRFRLTALGQEDADWQPVDVNEARE